MKILILHDYFLYKGGGERLIITLAKALNADVATAFIGEDAFNPQEHGIKTIELYKETFLSKLPGFRYLQVQFSFLFKTKFMNDYDLVIHSGDTLTALMRPKKTKHIAYMHTPPRHLFDSYQDRLKSYGLIKKLIFIPYAWVNKIRFKRLSKRFDLIITNSKTVKKRVKTYLNLDSKVAYPPCNIDYFKWKGQEDYYLSWARLYPAKRVDKIVEAFKLLPKKKLVVASGGPEFNKLKKLAEGFENIEVRGWVEEDELLKLLGNCIATIYVPVREDFGMTPVESMSAGKPVIGVAEGGLKETIIDGKTGILLDPDFEAQDIANAVNELGKEKAMSMREECEERAKDFSEDKFVEAVKGLVGV